MWKKGCPPTTRDTKQATLLFLLHTHTQLDSFQRAASSRSTGKFAFFAKRRTPAGEDVEVPITLDEMLVYSTVRGV